MHRVAVYGSLRHGMGNHRILEDSEFIGNIKVFGYTMVSLGAFPAIVPTGKFSDGPITCEEYLVTDRVFKNLDMLEGYPNFYDRCMLDHAVEPAWIYFINDKELLDNPIVEGGDWVSYKGD